MLAGSPSLWASSFSRPPVSANDVAVVSSAKSVARVQEPHNMAICSCSAKHAFFGGY